VDELRAFVDAHVAATVADADDVHGKLRALLARRLVREGRRADALAYVDDAAMADLLRALDDDYRAGFDHNASAEQKASARFSAAVILRDSGMELSGTELAPDWTVFGGSFELDDIDIASPQSQLGYAEMMRAAASRPEPNKRFHYRYVAAELVSQAADLLPQRSQAYAAVLCRASSFLVHRDAPAASVYWRRYVAYGARVDFVGAFGEECPAPDFDRAFAAPSVPAVLHARVHKRVVVRDSAILLALVLAVQWTARRIARRPSASLV
ncbi:MAG TPA: hypothetical protein VGO62_06970, partial [Myxococcota bacterium]